MKITLVRHGETDYNKKNRLLGERNILLNDTGRRQCKWLRAEIKDNHFDICFSSPLVRAFETAMILVGDKVEIKSDIRLKERYFGKLEGVDRKKIKSKKYWDYSLDCNDDGVENITKLFDRVNSFVNYLNDNYKDKNILIVSHGSVIRVLHTILNRIDYQQNIPLFNIPNCYIEEIDYK